MYWVFNGALRPLNICTIIFTRRHEYCTETTRPWDEILVIFDAHLFHLPLARFRPRHTTRDAQSAGRRNAVYRLNYRTGKGDHQGGSRLPFIFS